MIDLSYSGAIEVFDDEDFSNADFRPGSEFSQTASFVALVGVEPILS